MKNFYVIVSILISLLVLIFVATTFTYIISGAVISVSAVASGPNSIRIISASVEPDKVMSGDILRILVDAESVYGIENITADIGGIENVSLANVDGDIYKGSWQYNWEVHSTEQKEYNISLTIVDRVGNLLRDNSLTFQDPVTLTFSYTGAEQTWVVPAGITQITVDVRGAQGASGTGSCQGGPGTPGSGGNGGRVQGTVYVTPGETLYIYVGGLGSGGTGGFNGGGAGNFCGGGGGGASDIRQGGSALVNRVAITGGGGGGGGAGNGGTGGFGGGGGGTGGFSGASGTDSSTGGTGGTQTSGGIGGSSSGLSGSLGTGGRGGCCDVFDDGQGGGGGGGYYGGGGGGAVYNGGSPYGASGGGGGSSLVPAGGTTTSGYQAGNGQIIITYTIPKTPVGSSTSWTWVEPAGGNIVKSGSSTSWTWQTYTAGSGRKIPQGSDATSWVWSNE